jgi:hypothetical protein
LFSSFLLFAEKEGWGSHLFAPFLLHFFCSPKRNEAKKRAFPEGLRKFLAMPKPRMMLVAPSFLFASQNGIPLASPLFLKILQNLNRMSIYI